MRCIGLTNTLTLWRLGIRGKLRMTPRTEPRTHESGSVSAWYGKLRHRQVRPNPTDKVLWEQVLYKPQPKKKKVAHTPASPQQIHDETSHCQISEALDSRVLLEHFLGNPVDVAQVESQTHTKKKETPWGELTICTDAKPCRASCRASSLTIPRPTRVFNLRPRLRPTRCGRMGPAAKATQGGSDP